MEPPERILQIALAAAPALVAALFTAGTAALASLPRARKTALSESLRSRPASALQRYLANSTAIETRWLVTRALGIAASAALFTPIVPEPRPLWAVACVIAAFGVPAQLLSVLGRRHAEVAAPLFLRALRPIEWLVWPLAAPFELLVGGVSSEENGHRPPSATVTEAEVEILVNEGELNGSLDHDQSEMIRNVLDFREVRAGDIMVPRTRVDAVDIETDPHDLLQLIAESEHSRYPVFKERIDNVVGILHVKDLLTHIRTTGLDRLRVKDIMRTPVVFVPETQPAPTVLEDMRVGRRHHMAIVIDEFGSMSGVVTLEDFVEEIVGEIRDEHDDDDTPILELGEGRFMVDAGIALSDLERHLGVEFPEDTEYHSLGGMMVEALGRVPEVGATVRRAGYRFTVREADERHVKKVEAQQVAAA